MSLKELRDEISRLTRSRDNFQKEMKEALVKLSIAQRNLRAAKRYYELLHKSFKMIGGKIPEQWVSPPSKKTDFVVIGSDRGLAKGLHSSLLHKLINELKNTPEVNRVYILGNRTVREFKYNVHVKVIPWRGPNAEVARQLLIELLDDGSKIKLVYFNDKESITEDLIPFACVEENTHYDVFKELSTNTITHSIASNLIFAQFWLAMNINFLNEQKLRYETTSNAKDVTNEIIDINKTALQRLRQQIITIQVQENQTTRILTSGGRL